MTSGSYWRDRAILVELGANLLEGSGWYVRFGRRQLLSEWLNQHTPEQVQEMFAHTAAHEGIPLRVLELFPIVEPTNVRVGRVYFPNDLQESDVEQLRGFLESQARGAGLELETETIRLQVKVSEAVGIMLAFTAIAR